MRHLLSLCLCVCLATSLLAQEGDTLPVQESAISNTFAETVAPLDAGGELLLYLSTEQAIKRLQEQLQAVSEQPASPYNQGGQMMVVWRGMYAFLQRTGLADMTGIGVSSIYVEPELARNRMMLHRTESEGMLWQLFGDPTKPLSLDTRVPANADFVFASTFDAQRLLRGVQETAADVMPMMAGGIVQMQRRAAQAAGMDFDQALADYAGEYALSVTFSQDERVPVELESGNEVSVPKPSLLIAIKTNGSYLYDALAANAWKQSLQATEATHNGITMMVAGAQVGDAEWGATPALAQYKDLLLIGSSPAAVAAIADNEKTLSEMVPAPYLQKLPESYHSLLYVGPRINTIVQEVVDQQPELAGMMQAEIPVGLGMMQVQPDGLLFTSNSPKAAAFLVAQVLAMPLTLATPAALPRLMQAQPAAQQKDSLMNLKQLGLGMLMFSGDQEGHFPKGVGHAGLNELIDDNYIQNGKVFVHPAEEARMDRTSANLQTEAATSYAYVGAGLKDDNARATATPILVEKPAADRDSIGALFVDGHAEVLNFPDATTVEDVIKTLRERNPRGISDADYELLLKNAKAIDAAEAAE